MSPQDVRKTERSENGDQKPKLNGSAGSEWTFSSIPYHPDRPPYTLPLLASSLASGGYPPINGYAPPPRSNSDMLDPSLPSLSPGGYPPVNGHYPSNGLPPTSYLDASTSYLGALPFYPAASQSPAPIAGPATQLPLIPPPASNDDSSTLPPVGELLKRTAIPAMKTAGARRSTKAKGKAKALDEYLPATQGNKRKSMDDPPEEVEPKRPRGTRGRTKNSPNYFKEDLDVLLDLTQEILPIGARGWEEVGRRFNEIAVKMDRPTRPAKSLELKVKNLAKATKPTGSAMVPEHIQRALAIDDLISAKAGAVDLDDNDLQDINSDEDNEDDGDDDISQKKSKAQYIARRTKTPKPSTSQIRNSNQTFLTNIGLALDPSSRQARQENLQVQVMQGQQIASLTQQLRDAQKCIDSLGAQLIETERRYQAAERRADHAEMQPLIASAQNQPRSDLPPHIHNPIRSNPAPRCELYRQDIIRSDGQCTLWVGGSSDEENYVTGVNDSPGTRRYTYPDPRSYQPSTSASSSSYHAPSSSRHTRSHSQTTHTETTPDNADVDDAGTECSQPL